MIDYMDEVKNKVSGVIGIVNAIYTIDNVQYIDVLCIARIYYKSPLSNWELIRKNEE